jgi:hypothetical protein
MIQLGGKSQVGRLGRMYKNIICLHPLGCFYNYLDFSHLVEDTKISASLTIILRAGAGNPYL